ncbi:MAG: carboxypeptidase regulatory-like domain-containing protein [Acidimicrobiales bacterium]
MKERPPLRLRRQLPLLLAVLVLALLAGTVVMPRVAQAASTARLTGSVVDGLDSRPLSGMTVELFPSSSPPTALTPPAPVASLTTGADGRFEVALAQGCYPVEVSDPAGFYGMWRSGICVTDASSELIEARLFAGGTLGGLITEEAGSAPIPGVCVTVYGPLPDRPSALPAGCSGPDGTYRSPTLPPGSYHVYFADPSGQWSNTFLGGAATMEGATPVQLTAGTEPTTPTIANMALSPVAPGESRVSGRVTEAGTGLAVPACILISGPGSARWQGCTPTGEYRSSPLPAGSYRLSVGSPGATHRGASASFDLNGPLTLDFSVERSSSISGTITDQHGAPAAGVSVQTCGLEGPNGMGLCPGPLVRSDTTGAFQLTNLGDGIYRLFLSGAGYQSEYWLDATTPAAALPIEVTGPGQDLVVAPVITRQAGAISGVVRGDGGMPLVDAAVHLHGTTPGPLAFTGRLRTVYSGPDGSYRFGPLDPGSYRIEAVALDHVSKWFGGVPSNGTAGSPPPGAAPVPVATAEQAGVDFDLDVEATLSGVVAADVSGGGRSAFYCVALVSAGARFSDCALFGAPYLVEKVPAGRYELEVTASGYATHTESALDLVAGQAAARRVTLAARGAITGIVTDASTGTPLQAAVALVEPTSLTVVATAVADTAGRYVLFAPPGNYLVRSAGPAFPRLYRDTYYPGTTDPSAASNVTLGGADISGVDLAVVPLPAISGRITDVNGAPVPFAGVYGSDSFGMMTVTGSTGLDGTYRLGVPYAGGYVVSVSHSSVGTRFYPGVGSRSEATILSVGDAGLSGIDMVLGPLPPKPSISGTVRNLAGDPLSNISVTAGPSPMFPAGSAITGLDGTYQIGNLAPGSYLLQFTAVDGSYHTAVYGSTGGSPGTEIVLSPGEQRTGIDAALEPRVVTIAGTVTDDATGAPVGASVWLVNEQGSLVQWITTNPFTGAYEVFAPSGTWRLRVDASGYFSQHFDGASRLEDAQSITVVTGGPTQTANVALTPSFTITGTVADVVGNVRPDITVTVHPAADRAGPATATTTTLWNGFYRLDGLEAGDYVVRFSDPSGEYQTEWYADGATPEAATVLSLVPGAFTGAIDARLAQAPAVITGTLTAATGDPIGARVTALLNGRFPLGTVDADPSTGRFRLQVQGAPYLIEIRRDGYETQSHRVTLRPGQTFVLDAVLEVFLPRATLSGTVTAGGTPLASAQVTAYLPNGTAIRTAFTDALGRYEMTQMRANTYLLQFVTSSGGWHPQWYAGSATRDGATPVVAAPGANVTGISAELTKPELSGLVTDTAGRPLAGLPVTLNGPGGPQRAYTGGDGRYAFGTVDHLPAGTTTITVDGGPVFEPGGVAEPIEVTMTTRRLDLDVILTASPSPLYGRIIDPDGVPVASSWLALFGSDGGFSTSTYTDQNGRYRFDGVAPGTYVLYASGGPGLLAEYWSNATTVAGATPIEVTSEVAITELVVELEQTSTISGRATDEYGSGQAYRTVFVFDPNGYYVTWAQTDFDGSYRVEGLQPGDYRVMVSGAGVHADTYHPNVTSLEDAAVVTVSRGGGATGVDVTMVSFGSITGRVVDSAGRPLAGIQVGAQGWLWVNTTTAEDGTYELANLPNGDYLVWFASSDGSYANGYHPGLAVHEDAVPVTVRAGVTSAGIDARLTRYAVVWSYGGDRASSGAVGGTLGGELAMYLANGAHEPVTGNRTVDRVSFRITDPNGRAVADRVDRSAPFDVFGSGPRGLSGVVDTARWRNGVYRLEATVVLADRTQERISRTFTVANDRGPNVLRWSPLADRSYPADLDGASLSGRVAVYLDINPAVVERVTFRLDGARQAFQVDPSAPFDLGGTDSGGRARLLDAARRLGRGPHTLTAEVTFHDGTTATTCARFTVN